MDIILLVFLSWYIGKKAKQKGLKPGQWKLRLVLVWLCFEFMGFFLGVQLFGFSKDNMIGLAAFALVCAFGGYLIVKASLDKKADPIDEDEINNLGAN